jgi:hypothetical protein
MSQSSGFLRELDEELADAPTSDGRSPSVSSTGEAAVTSKPPQTLFLSRTFLSQRNSTGQPNLPCKRKAADTQNGISPANGVAAKHLASCREPYATREDVARVAGQCTHEVIYRGLCGMCVSPTLVSCEVV